MVSEQLKQRLLAVQKTHEMLEDMRAAIADARVHVLVGHPKPDPCYLGDGLLGDVEVNVHVLVIYCSCDRNLQYGIAMSKLVRIPPYPPVVKHTKCVDNIICN